MTKSLSFLTKIDPSKKNKKEYQRISFMYQISTESEKYLDSTPYLASEFFNEEYPILSDEFLKNGFFDV